MLSGRKHTVSSYNIEIVKNFVYLGIVSIPTSFKNQIIEKEIYNSTYQSSQIANTFFENKECRNII
uniref:Uncharacterized protein n=1 Tax=Megaselia scalaris TaxID=36166 RepID=T1GP18_MEGSC